MKILQLLLATIGFLLVNLNSFSQCSENMQLWKKIVLTDENEIITSKQKLHDLYTIKELIEKCGQTNDTTYVLVLIKVGAYEEWLNKNYIKAIDYTQKALKLNARLKPMGSKELRVMAYFKLAFFYDQQYLYKKALNYYDSVIFSCKTIIDTNAYEINAHSAKTYIYSLTGDYYKAVDESNLGILYSLQKKDTANYIYFLNRKAWALYNQDELSQALQNIKDVIPLAKREKDTSELSTSLKLAALIYGKKNKFDTALYFYNQCIKISLSLNYAPQVASDYNDLGNFYLDYLHQYKQAAECYNKTLIFASKIENPLERSSKNILAYTNLGASSLEQNKLEQTGKFLLLTFSNLNINLHGNVNNNPSSMQLSAVANKDVVFGLLDIKIRLHLKQFKKTNQKKFLDICLRTCMLTDSVMTQLRHEQLGEQSKLYWRNKTRSFFTNAIEASYLAGKPDIAFYFMEKSRAVLLNDKLNELNASSYLSKTDAAKQEYYEIKMVELEQKIAELADTSKQYQVIQLQLLKIKDDYEQFIKSLEKKYPAYYQYKYDDEVPSLKNLQSFLRKNNQSFVHYFLDDSATYILAITATNTKLLRLSQAEFNKDDLPDFLQLCANKEMLNNHYNSFATLSNLIYKKIFQPLQLPKGRIIICSDNIVIPFDALCSDEKGKYFMLNDYSFGYVYSARFLMKQFNSTIADGNFLGFAPVSFAKYLDVNDLKNAADALNASASYYKSDKLFTHQNATRRNFFNYAFSYSIVSIFSHARADTTNKEPVLYMQDSLIYLSELQLLNNPATKLVLLSACQTNVGKAATGEGIYSLARGFATAGIPSVAATLWKADEQTIYTISEKFNEYLSEGINKDEALQKAKLYFIQNNSGEKLLPYYWANMIVIGNTDAISFSSSANSYWWWIAAGIFFIGLVGFSYRILRVKRK